MTEIIVNTIGEAFSVRGKERERDIQLVDAVKPAHVAKLYLNAQEFDVWENQFDEEAQAINRYVMAKCEEEQLHAAWDLMPLPMFDFYKRVRQLQAANDERFKVWGRKVAVSFKSPEYIWLTTEFAGRISDNNIWDKLKQIAKKPYSTTTLHENYFHTQRQVELRVNVVEISNKHNPLVYLQREIDKMRRITEPLWEIAGLKTV